MKTKGDGEKVLWKVFKKVPHMVPKKVPMKVLMGGNGEAFVLVRRTVYPIIGLDSL